MNEFNMFFGLFVVFIIAVAVVTLLIWGAMLIFYMEKIDQYFDSPDFPHRGIKGLWPWEMGRAASYGFFYFSGTLGLFEKNSRMLSIRSKWIRYLVK